MKGKDILSDLSEYIESSEFLSWEHYFTQLLTELTRGSYLQYSKREINPAYLNPKAAGVILEKYEDIQILEADLRAEKH